MNIAGLKVDQITKQRLLEEISARLERREKTFIITPYSEFLYEVLVRPEILEIFKKADFSIPDGIGMFWAAAFLAIPLTAKHYLTKIIQAEWQVFYTLASIIFYSSFVKKYFPEKITGADLIWDIARLAAKSGQSVYLLGGFDQTPELAANKLKQAYPNLKIAGFSGKNPDNESVIKDINESGADILLVAYGPIRQEEWIVRHYDKLSPILFIGLGGTFDYIAGTKFTPPALVRSAGLEWLYRLITQPYRWKRIYNATFGMVISLTRHKVFSHLPFRPNVAIIILNKNNKVLVCERNPKDFYVDVISTTDSLKKYNYWQFPQGGVDPGEDMVNAARREAEEEAGLKQIDFLKVSESTHSYVWNNGLRKFWKNRHHANKGQTQHIVYFRYLGADENVKVDDHEFINFKWSEAKNLDKIIHPERKALTRIVMEDLKDTEELFA